MTLFAAQTPAAEQFFAASTQRPGQVLLALDFDGTLAPIVPDPADARLLPEAAEALAVLGAKLGQVAIITGRAVATVRELGRLDRRPGLENLIVLGQYGAERWDAATGREIPADIPEAVTFAKAEVEALLVTGFEGVVLEDKGPAIGVHTRRAPAPQAAYASLVDPLGEIAHRHGLSLERGRSVLELRASTVNKGDALSLLAEETGAGVVAMCGDDLGDLPAFEFLAELNRAGAVTCAVVSGSDEQSVVAQRADVLAAGPAGVAAWLGELARRLG